MMPSIAGYPKPSDLLEDLRRVFKNDEPEGGETSPRRRRMREALKADPKTFLVIFSRHQDQYDRRVAAWWSRKHKEPKRAKVAAEGQVLAPELEPEAENRAMDVLEGL